MPGSVQTFTDYARNDSIQTAAIDARLKAIAEMPHDSIFARIAQFQIEQAEREKLHPVGSDMEVQGQTGKIVGYACGYPMVQMPSAEITIRTPDGDEICNAPSYEKSRPSGS